MIDRRENRQQIIFLPWKEEGAQSRTPLPPNGKTPSINPLPGLGQEQAYGADNLLQDLENQLLGLHLHLTGGPKTAGHRC